MQENAPTSDDNIKSRISFAIFLFINFAFSVKYLSRATTYYFITASFITFAYIVFLHYRNQIASVFAKIKYINEILILIFILLMSILFLKIPVSILNVDRYSVITSFWENYFAGEYAYFAKSHMGNAPGPMPFYFMLALPFYSIGELGYFSLLGIIMFYLLLHYAKIEKNIQMIGTVLILTSVFYVWEVLCRSNIFLNGTLILFSIAFLYKNLKRKNSSSLIFNGIIIGLLLSTRNVFVIPYIIAFLFALKSGLLNLQQTIVIGIISIFIFALTFAPFVINHIEDFKVSNPFIIQSDVLMPFQFSFFCVGIAILGYFVCKKESDIYFYSGCLLFLTIVLHYAYQTYQNGFYEAFFNSRADISYFILCTPFLIYHVLFCNGNENFTMRFLSKRT